jgi:hypothetical protein
MALLCIAAAIVFAVRDARTFARHERPARGV